MLQFIQSNKSNKEIEMNTYNVFENSEKVATVKAVSAEKAIDKVETDRKSVV